MARKRWMLGMGLLVVISLVLAACGSPATPAAPEGGEEAPPPVTTEKITLDTSISTEPPALDPSTATDSPSIPLIRQMFIGLTSFDEKAQVIPSLATEWSVSEDGLTWTYKLRDDVRWVKLDPATGEFEDLGIVNAHDVVYGTKRVLDPNTASDYSFVLWVLEGGQDLNTADAADDLTDLLDAVGVEALDDFTVQFTLTAPAAYFPSITGMWVTFPIYRDAVEEHGDTWTDAGNIVTNGPYTLETWDHQAYMRFVKNPLWINADDVQIEVIQGPIITESSTVMAMYEANETDMMADPSIGPPLPDLDRIKADPQLSQELLIAPRLCTYWYGFTNTKPPMDNVLVRKAFSAAIDRQSLIDNVLKGEQRPAHSFAPPGIFGNVADDFSVGGWMVEDDYDAQVAQAQAWLEEAGYPEGEGLDLLLMHNTSEGHALIAQAIQAMWAEAFPKAAITIENQEWQVYLKTLLPTAPPDEKPHIFRQGWCADYPDQNNWLNEVYNSNSGQNYASFFNDEFDALIEEAAFEADPAKREALYKQAESLFVDEEAAVAPIYYYSFVRLYKPWLTKVVISPVSGDPIAQWRMDWEAKKAATGQ